MRTSTTRLTVVLLALLLSVGWFRPALADVPISGTVGELGFVQLSTCAGTLAGVRFKLTDANQTATCLDQAGTGAKYAYYWFNAQQLQNCQPNTATVVDTSVFREVFASLLVSKKGAPISCTIKDGQNCHVTSCTLP